VSLRHIRSAIADNRAKSAASSLVCSCLDYANSLLFGTTQQNINCIQRVQSRCLASYALTHLIFFIGSPLINASNSNFPP